MTTLREAATAMVDFCYAPRQDQSLGEFNRRLEALRLAALAEQPAAPAAPVLTDAEIKAAVFAELRNINDQRLWRALTYDSGPYEVTNLSHGALTIARAILARAIPPGHVVVPVENLELLRFIQRVLEGDAPQADRDAAAQMVRDLRRSVAARPGVAK